MRLWSLCLITLLSPGCGPNGGRAADAAPDSGPAEPQLLITSQVKDADEPRGVVFTPDGGHLLVLTGVASVWAFDAAGASLRERGWFGFAEDREAPPPGLTDDLGKLRAWVDRHPSLEAIAVTPDGSHVIGGARTGLGLWRLTPTGQPVATLVGKTDDEDFDLYGMALAPDGRSLIALRRPSREQADAARERLGLDHDVQGTIERWDVDPAADPPLRRRAAAFVEDRPAAAAFTADGMFAAVVGSSRLLGVARLSDPDAVVFIEQGADDTQEEIVALPGDRFATGGFDEVVRLWQLEREGPWLIQLGVMDRVHAGKLRAMAAAPDGRWLVAASDDHALSFWPAASWSRDQVTAPVLLRPPIEYVHALAVHPAGPWLATAGDGVRVWRVNRDRLSEGAGSRPSVARQITVQATNVPIVAAGWIDEVTLVTASADGSVQRWRDGVKTEIRPATAGDGVDTRFVSDVGGGVVMLGQVSGSIFAVNLASGVETKIVLDPPETRAAIELAGNCVATGAAKGAVQTWRRDGTTLTPAGRIEAGLTRVVTLAWTDDARVLLVAGDDADNAGKLMVAAVDPSTCVAGAMTSVVIPPTPSGSVGSSVSYPGGGGAAPICAAFSRDGAALLTGDRDGGGAILWKVEPGPNLTKVEFLLGHTGGVFAAGFSPDGRHAITGGSAGETYLWDVAGRRRIEALQPASQPAWFHEDVAWSPGGSRVALTGGWSNNGRVWWYELAL